MRCSYNKMCLVDFTSYCSRQIPTWWLVHAYVVLHLKYFFIWRLKYLFPCKKYRVKTWKSSFKPCIYHPYYTYFTIANIILPYQPYCYCSKYKQHFCIFSCNSRVLPIRLLHISSINYVLATLFKLITLKTTAVRISLHFTTGWCQVC